MNTKRIAIPMALAIAAAAGLHRSMTGESKAVELKRTEDATRPLARSQNSSPTQAPAVIIQTAASPGSGVIVGRNGPVYTILTAAHVIKGNRSDELQIHTANGRAYTPIAVEVPLGEYDLAALRFRSNDNLPVAIIPFLDPELWKNSSDYNTIAVSGYAISSSSVKSSPLREVSGQLIALMQDNADGYNLMYNAVTNVGMSGSGVFAHPGYGKWTPFMYKTPQGNRYGYTDLSAITAGIRGDSPMAIREGLQIWNREVMNASQNNYYDQYCASLTGVERIPCISYARQASGICMEDMNQRSTSLAAKMLLIGIHGRSEEYAYGGKSGSALGMYLGEPKIKAWLEKNKDIFGLAPEFSYAKRSCELGRHIEPTPFQGLGGVTRIRMPR